MSKSTKLSINSGANDVPSSSLNTIPSPSSSNAKSANNSQEEIKNLISSLFSQQNERLLKIEERINQQEDRNENNNAAINNNHAFNDNTGVKYEERKELQSRATPGAVSSSATSTSASTEKQKKTKNLVHFFNRISEANGAKLGLNESQLEELSSFMQEESTAKARADAFLSGDEEVSLNHTQFDSDLIPYKPGEKQTIEQALADILKVKTKTIKRFESFEALLTLFNKQLFTFISADCTSSPRVCAWMKYYNFVMKLSFTHTYCIYYCLVLS